MTHPQDPVGSASPAAEPSPAALPPPPPPPLAAVEFPVGWILDHASSPIRYRSLIEVAKLHPVPPLLPSLPYTYSPALRLAISQSGDGTWGQTMLGEPSTSARPDGKSAGGEFEGVGTVSAVQRLLEYGWDRDAPTLIAARRVLFRLLAEDDQPDFLYEFGAGERSPELTHRGRVILREAAAAALAHAGYEGDPRLRGAAKRILERVGEFLDSPLASKPWIRVGNKHVLSPDTSPPSMHALIMLSYMPLFRFEHHQFLERLYEYLVQPLPRQELQQMIGKHIVAQPHLVLGDPLATRSVADSDIPFALLWLETVARLGFLRRNENWMRLFERFVDDRNRDLVWRAGKGEEGPLPTESPYVWPSYPLEPPGANGVAAEVTFKLGLIGRLSGRSIELV